MGPRTAPPGLHLASNLLLHYAVMAAILGAAWAACVATGDAQALASAAGLS